METTLPNGKVITLNSQQVGCLGMLDNWWNDKTELFALIMGYAGTGKTTLSRCFTEKVRKSIYDQIVVSAPTHKAKRVIQVSTGFPGESIQALLGMAPDTDLSDFDPNKPEFAPKKDPKIQDYKFLIIDEGSMLNAFLSEYLMDVAEEHGTKILVICDPAQLPPVGEVVSPIITTERIKYRYELTQVERQKGDNPLMEFYTDVRNNLTSSRNFFPSTSTLNEAGEGLIVNRDNVQFAKDWMRALKDEITPGSVKMLAFYNDTVRAWNKFYRQCKYGKQVATSEPIKVGDILMGYGNTKGRIQNSAEYLVQEVSPINRTFNTIVGGSMVGWEAMMSNDVAKEEIKTPEIRCFFVKLVDLIDGNIVSINILHPDDTHLMLKPVQKYISACAKAKSPKLWFRYFDWRATFYSMVDIEVGKRKVIKMDIDYGWAITVHKAQGSTYSQVFVDYIDISRQHNVKQRNQMVYSATTRPTNIANVLLP